MARITLPRQVGIIIASARKAQGLTQSQLAQAAGVSRQLVNRLETGVAPGIALNKLMSILDAAGCTLDVSPTKGAQPDEGRRFSNDLSIPQPPSYDTQDEYLLDATLFDSPNGANNVT